MEERVDIVFNEVCQWVAKKVSWGFYVAEINQFQLVAP